MSNDSKTLIVFAWAMEIVGVTGGVINSSYTTFGENPPETFLGYFPAIPMVALAVAELGRVPLASVVYSKHKLIQIVAISGILALGYLAVENWTFGFERIVELRLKPVNSAAQDLARAEADLNGLQLQRDQLAAASKEKRGELGKSLAIWDESIGRNTAQLSQEAKSHQENLAQIREACRLIRERCMAPRSQAEDARYSNEIARISTELTNQRSERNKIQSELQGLTKTDAERVSELEKQLNFAAGVAKEHRQALRLAADGNQVYRLAASWYGVAVTDVTPQQFANARLVFATFSSIAVALAGTVAALVYYARSRIQGTQSDWATLIKPLIRARRAYYARKRKPVVRELVGPERVVFREGPPPPVVVEKEVTRFVDRIVLIPRFGIRFPMYVNKLFSGGPSDKESEDLGPNVTAFSKRGAGYGTTVGCFPPSSLLRFQGLCAERCGCGYRYEHPSCYLWDFFVLAPYAGSG